MQFTGVPGCGRTSLSLVDDSLSSFDPDPKRWSSPSSGAVARPGPGATPSTRAASSTILATPEQQLVIAAHRGPDEACSRAMATDHGPGRHRPGAQRRAVSSVLHDRRSPRAQPGCCRRSSASRPSQQYEEGEKFLETLEAAGGEGIELCAAARSTLPRPGRDPRPAAPLAVEGDPRPPPERRELAGGCTFPEGTSCARLRGRDFLAFWSWPPAPAAGHGRPRRPRPAPRVRGRPGTRRRRRYGAGFRAEKVDVAPGPNLEARARAARLAVLPPERPYWSRCRRPGRDGPAQPRLGAPASTAWPACGANGILSSTSAGTKQRRCARPKAWSPTDPTNFDPVHPATGCRPS